MEEKKILRPTPRQNGMFSLTPVDTNIDMGSDAHSPSEVTPTASLSADSRTRSAASFQKSRSILNLTSSTLFGIYSPTGDDTNREDALNTPWGTGSQTPIRKTSPGSRSPQFAVEKVQEKTGRIQGTENETIRRHVRTRSMSGARRPVSKARQFFRLFIRSAALCLIGLAYGSIVTQLHGTKGLAPVRVENVDRSSWAYLGFWAASGLVLGNLLPWVDQVWGTNQDEGEQSTRAGELKGEKISGSGTDKTQERPSTPTTAQARNSLGADWNPVVRSIGAFVGIAFAMYVHIILRSSCSTGTRRLPWQSTLQLSLTLALANPVIWYLVDRSRNGLLLSMVFSVTGASALLSINPAMLPTPRMQAKPTTTEFGLTMSGQRNVSATAAAAAANGLVETTSYETMAVATWIASVLFCSCVCFGNIGRRLMPGTKESWSV